MHKNLESLAEPGKTKHCWGCKQVLSIELFGNDRSKKDGKARECKECSRKRQRISYYKNPRARVRATMRWKAKKKEREPYSEYNARMKVKKKMVDGYGGKCTCCGESTMEFMTLEHINGDGKQHREKASGSQGTYRDVIRMGFPEEYTALCMNCNHARRYGRKCPHEEPGFSGKTSVKMSELVEALRALRDQCDMNLPDPIPESVRQELRAADELLAKLEADQ